MGINSQFHGDFLAFTKEILNGKPYFLGSKQRGKFWSLNRFVCYKRIESQNQEPSQTINCLTLLWHQWTGFYITENFAMKELNFNSDMF